MNQARNTLLAAALALFGLSGCSQDQAEVASAGETGATQQASNVGQISDQRIINAESEPGNWLSHGRDFGEQRFSPLTQINAETVSQLGLEFEVDLKSNGAMEATPIMSSTAIVKNIKTKIIPCLRSFFESKYKSFLWVVIIF